MQAMSLALGANRQDKGRVNNEVSRIQLSRIESALVYVRRSAQYRELKLPDFTQSELTTVAMVDELTCRIVTYAGK